MQYAMPAFINHWPQGRKILGCERQQSTARIASGTNSPQRESRKRFNIGWRLKTGRAAASTHPDAIPSATNGKDIANTGSSGDFVKTRNARITGDKRATAAAPMSAN